MKVRSRGRATGVRVGWVAVILAATLSVFVVTPHTDASATGLGGVNMARACQLQYPGQNRQVVVRNTSSAWSWACWSPIYGNGGINVTAECVSEYGYGAAAYVSDPNSAWTWYCSWNVTDQMRSAVTWANAEMRSPDPTWSDYNHHAWSGLCEAFTTQAEGFPHFFASALDDYRWQLASGRLHTTGTPPAGALVFWDGGTAGHTAVSIGGGQAIGTYGYFGQRLPVRQYAIIGFLTNHYLGWAYPYGS